MKKYYNLFDNKVSNFVNSDALEQQIEQQQITNVTHDNLFRSAKINSIKTQNSEDLDTLKTLKKKRKTQKRVNLLKMLKQNLMMRLKTKI